MKRRFNEIKPLIIVTAILALLLLGCAWALAEEDGIRIKAQVGYDGTVLCGRWIPLRMELIAGDAPYEGQVCVDIGVKHAYYDRLCLPVSLDAGETKMVSLPVRPLVEQDSFSVTLESEGQIDAQSTAMAQMLVPEDALVIGVAGGQRALCEALSAIEERSIHGELEVICAIPLDEQSFPDEIVILWIAVLDQRPLHGFFVGVSGDIYLVHGAGVKPGVVHNRGQGRGRGIEVLYLLRVVTHFPDVFCQFDGFL